MNERVVSLSKADASIVRKDEIMRSETSPAQPIVFDVNVVRSGSNNPDHPALAQIPQLCIASRIETSSDHPCLDARPEFKADCGLFQCSPTGSGSPMPIQTRQNLVKTPLTRNDLNLSDLQMR